MKSSELLLEEGKRAVKARKVDDARRLLMQAIELDEQNTPAWLWLSGVVDTNEDRRICLDNVLAIDPDNAAAKKGIARLTERLTVPIIPATDSGAEMTIPATNNGSSAVSMSPHEMETTRTNIPLNPQQSKKKDDRLTTIMLVLGAVFFVVAILIVGVVAIGSAAGNDSVAEQVAPAEPVVDPKVAVLAVMRENVAAMNVGDIARYMATIHSNSPGYRETENAMEIMVEQYDLTATWDKAEVTEVGRREARVDFVLTTKKVSGPAFRDNRVEGEMILRLEDGAWKIYNQSVDDITYLN